MAFDPTAAYGRIDLLQTLKRPRSPSPKPPSPKPPSPRPATPDPIDTLPASMRRIAELIGDASAAPSAPTTPALLPAFQMPPLLNAMPTDPPARAGPIPPDPHCGVLREDGGIRGWLAMRRRVAL